jgi:hypothetical protein
MATSEEKQELVEDIKRPTRYYRVSLWGYGSEIYYAPSSKEEYDFWVTNAEQRRSEAGLEEYEDPFERYMFYKDDEPKLYSNVPENLQREYDYYDYNEVDHIEGPDYDSTNIAIEEVEIVDNDHYNIKVINTIVEDSELAEFVMENDIDSIVDETVAFEKEYLYTVVSSRKGTFFEGLIETAGRLDLSKLSFEVTEMHNGETIVHSVKYDGEHVDNWGSDANDKGTEIRIINMQD